MKEPSEEDMRKFRRLLQYIHGTLDIPRVMSSRSILEMSIYVNASHAPHEDARGHMGDCIVMGLFIVVVRNNKSTRKTIL